MSYPLISAVILNYNSSSETLGLYQNLKEDFTDNLQITVVDNASAVVDRKQLKKNIPEENLILTSKNLGYAGGNNIGIQRAINAEAEYIWILNPDIRVEPDALGILMDLMQRDRNLAAVGPRIISRSDIRKIFTDGETMDLSNGLNTFHKNHNAPVSGQVEQVDYEVDYVDGSSILLRTAAIRELGFLPEEYFLYWEETDWCTNAIRNNWKLAVDKRARVYNLNSKKGANYHFYFNRNKLLFAKKYGLSYGTVRKREIQILFKEIKNRFNGKFLKPFFVSRLKGTLSGILKTAF